MADELRDALTPTDEQLENAKTFGKVAAATAGLGYAGGKMGQSLLSSVVDTQGYGTHSPIAQYAKGGKISQALHNALQAGGLSLRGGARELSHSLVTGESLELKAMESRIRDIQAAIAKDKKFNFLSPKEKELLNLDLKNAKNTLQKRQLLVGNTKIAVGKDASMIPTGDSFRTKKIVSPQIAKIEPGMARYVGKEIDALHHGPTQIKDFKSKAKGDPRIRRIKDVFGSGSRNALSNVKKVIANNEYNYGREIRKFPIGQSGLPENARGQVVGHTKLTELKSGQGRWKLPNGARTRTFRLGFVPINTMGHGKALEYVAGQHWQYMDFAKIGGRYVAVKGGMRDVHDLGVGRATRGAERLFAKPVLNYADWKYPVRKKEIIPREYPKHRKTSRILRAASAPARVYAPEAAAKMKPELLSRGLRIAQGVLNIKKNPSLLLKALSGK